jgi:hypothetical protein
MTLLTIHLNSTHFQFCPKQPCPGKMMMLNQMLQNIHALNYHFIYTVIFPEDLAID